MKLKKEGEEEEEERVVEDGRKQVGCWGMGDEGRTVVSDCMVCLALCEREGYVRF